MSVIECCPHTYICRKSSKDNEDVENLMRREEIVESAWSKPLWNPIRADMEQGKRCGYWGNHRGDRLTTIQPP